MTLGQFLSRRALGEERFYLSVQDVRKIIAVDSASFQQWLARGLIPFSTIRAGNRTWRRFNITQVPFFLLIDELLGNGVPVGEAIKNARLILNWKITGDSAPWAVLWFRREQSLHFPTNEGFVEALDEENRASCIFLYMRTLESKIQHAVATVKNSPTHLEV